MQSRGKPQLLPLKCHPSCLIRQIFSDLQLSQQARLPEDPRAAPPSSLPKVACGPIK